MPTGMLPASAAVLLALVCRARWPERGWLDAILSAAIGVAVLTVALAEGLGLLGAIRIAPLVAVWSGVHLALGIALYRLGGGSGLLSDLRRRVVVEHPSSWGFGVTAIAAATLLIALSAPPNTWDSMTYHLARVAHWLQNGSLAHYPTNFPRQLLLAPGAEMLVLQLQALAGGDRFANCVQWAAYGLSALSAMLLARQLGAGRAGERFAATFVLTVPMLVLQSTSTQNDLVTALWLAAFVLYGLRWLRTGGTAELWRAALAIGLAVLTKGTALLFAAPFAVGLAVADAVHHRARSLRAALLVVGCIAALNGGHFLRNLQVYGHPLGAGEEGPKSYQSEIRSPASLVSGLTRNAALQLAAPSERWNRGVAAAVRRVHRTIVLSPQHPATTWQGFRFDVASPNRHEDREGAPLHFLLAVALLGAATLRQRLRPRDPAWLVVCLGVLAGAALFAFLLRWQPWHTRLHVPLWVLLAPCLGAVLERLRRRWIRAAISIALALWAVPVVLYGNPRPLLGPGSVITTPRSVQYFANRPDLRAEYETMARRVRHSGETAVGLRLAGNDWEYPLWVLLGPGIELRHVGVANESAAAGPELPDEPSAVICTDDEARAELAADPAWRETVNGASSALFERRSR